MPSKEWYKGVLLVILCLAVADLNLVVAKVVEVEFNVTHGFASLDGVERVVTYGKSRTMDSSGFTQRSVLSRALRALTTLNLTAGSQLTVKSQALQYTVMHMTASVSRYGTCWARKRASQCMCTACGSAVRRTWMGPPVAHSVPLRQARPLCTTSKSQTRCDEDFDSTRGIITSSRLTVWSKYAFPGGNLLVAWPCRFHESERWDLRRVHCAGLPATAQVRRGEVSLAKWPYEVG